MSEFDPIITAEDLQTFVQSQDDFGLELFVYSKARELGYQATHGGSYADRVTGKTRQYDVRATIGISQNSDPGLNASLRVTMAIECKCLKPTNPLLVSRIPRLLDESFHQRIIAAETRIRNKNGNIQHGSSGVESVKGLESFYVPNAYVGKSTAQVSKAQAKDKTVKFATIDAEIFEKWGQALASANDLVQGAALPSERSYPEALRMVLPVLVVSNDTLWVADYSENGSLQDSPKKVDSVEMYVGERYTLPHSFNSPDFVISHMHIVTKDAAVSFLDSFANDVLYRRRLANSRGEYRIMS